jgi:hypothetical protein
VNVNDITDSLTIRVATVNGTAAETAARNGVLQIRAITRNEFDANARLQYARGEIQGFTNNRVANLVIPDTIWGDPVISIREGAFQNTGLSSVTIPGSITSIGAGVFSDNRLMSVTIGNGVTSIGARAFWDNRFYSVIIPDSVKSIGEAAFQRSVIGKNEYLMGYPVRGLNGISIGANVAMEGNPFQYSFELERYDGGTDIMHNNSFRAYYDQNDKRAGTYIWNTEGKRGHLKWLYRAPRENPFQYFRGGVTFSSP